MAYTLTTIHQAPAVRISDSAEAWLTPARLRHLSRRERKELLHTLNRDPEARTVVLSVSAQSAQRMRGERTR